MKKDRRSWTDEQLKEAINTSKTKAEAIRKLGLALPGSYRIVNKYIRLLNLDISHLMSSDELVVHCRSFRQNIPIEELLTANSGHDYGYVKRRVIRAKLLPHYCAMCNIDSWRGEELVLHLDHINGINNDHRLENLRLLCPNCHSQTSTYCGRNQRKHPVNFCSCGMKITKGSKSCMKCIGLSRLGTKQKIVWPAVEELLCMVQANGFSKTGKLLGVSHGTVRKHLRKRKF